VATHVTDIVATGFVACHCALRLGFKVNCHNDKVLVVRSGGCTTPSLTVVNPLCTCTFQYRQVEPRFTCLALLVDGGIAFSAVIFPLTVLFVFPGSSLTHLDGDLLFTQLPSDGSDAPGGVALTRLCSGVLLDVSGADDFNQVLISLDRGDLNNLLLLRRREVFLECILDLLPRWMVAVVALPLGFCGRAIVVLPGEWSGRWTFPHLDRRSSTLVLCLFIVNLLSGGIFGVSETEVPDRIDAHTNNDDTDDD